MKLSVQKVPKHNIDTLCAILFVMHYRERLLIIREKLFHLHFQNEKSPRYTSVKTHLSENKALIVLSACHLFYFWFSVCCFFFFR